MIKTTILFQDLKEPTQCRIWQAVQNNLLATGTIEPKQEHETEDDFNGRVQEAIDHHINGNNLAQEFSI